MYFPCKSRDKWLPIHSNRYTQNYLTSFKLQNKTKMSSSGEEEETGPSVDANDPEERIAARRVRIHKRVEAARRYFFANSI